LSFDTKCFVHLENRHLDMKSNALLEYKSQGKRNYLSRKFILGLASARGIQAGCKYAECFEIIRLHL
jgi:N-acetylglucosamine malate deacetylase 1